MLGYLLAAFFGLLGAALVLGSIWVMTWDEIGGSLFFIFIGFLLIACANYFYQFEKGNIEPHIGYTLK